MGQDWKTLSLVVIGAAIAGWSMVRALGGGSNPHVASSTAAVATIPGLQRTTEATATPEADTPPPARIPGALAPPSGAPGASGDSNEVALIERDLALLSQGLVEDQRIEDRVMPRVNDLRNVPGVTVYRRPRDFWDSAFGGSAGTNP